MEIPFIIKSFVVFGVLLVYNIEARKYVSVVNLNDFNSLNNPQTIIVQIHSTWNSWFRSTVSIYNLFCEPKMKNPNEC